MFKYFLRFLIAIIFFGLIGFLLYKINPSKELRPPVKMTEKPRNVLGKSLKICCTDPITGFFRDGYCKTGPTDKGRHVVCAEMTEEFLEFTKALGNDLSTPYPESNFPGLSPGDRWCLSVKRWKEAHEDIRRPIGQGKG